MDLLINWNTVVTTASISMGLTIATWILGYAVFKQKVLDKLQDFQEKIKLLELNRQEDLITIEKNRRYDSESVSEKINAIKEDSVDKFNICHKRIDRLATELREFIIQANDTSREINSTLKELTSLMHYMKGVLDNHISVTKPEK